jgi:hypothetical protein
VPTPVACAVERAEFALEVDPEAAMQLVRKK